MDNLSTDGYDPLVCPHKSGLMLKRHGFENGNGNGRRKDDSDSSSNVY